MITEQAKMEAMSAIRNMNAIIPYQAYSEAVRDMMMNPKIVTD